MKHLFSFLLASLLMTGLYAQKVQLNTEFSFGNSFVNELKFNDLERLEGTGSANLTGVSLSYRFALNDKSDLLLSSGFLSRYTTTQVYDDNLTEYRQLVLDETYIPVKLELQAKAKEFLSMYFSYSMNFNTDTKMYVGIDKERFTDAGHLMRMGLGVKSNFKYLQMGLGLDLGAAVGSDVKVGHQALTFSMAWDFIGTFSE